MNSKLRRLRVVISAVLLVTMLGGCVVAAGPGVWVPGHYGPYGRWHRGHYTY